LGFSQAFLQAGARSVVLSRWEADDTATALLMVRFYENLLSAPARKDLKGPLPRAEALAEAQRWLRELPRKDAESLAAVWWPRRWSGEPAACPGASCGAVGSGPGSNRGCGPRAGGKSGRFLRADDGVAGLYVTVDGLCRQCPAGGSAGEQNCRRGFFHAPVPSCPAARNASAHRITSVPSWASLHTSAAYVSRSKRSKGQRGDAAAVLG
jgi:hypothetical protein